MLEAFIDPPQHFRRLTVFPIVARDGPVLPYLLTKDALDSGALTFQEEAGSSAPLLLVRNRSLYAVLILDGDRLRGEDRNQSAIRSILLAGKSVTQIPATPAEEQPSEVGGKDDALGEWLQAFPASDKQVGILAFLGPKVLGLEALGSPKLYAPAHEQFLIRYVREALGAEIAEGSETKAIAPATEANAAQLLESLETANRVQTEGVGLGEYWILKGPVQGGELIYDGQLVHLSVIPAEDDPPFDPFTPGAD
jgi:hypothetical protein